MIEVVLFLGLTVAAYFMLPDALKTRFIANKTVTQPTQPARRLKIPEDSILKRHFLTQLRAQIEAEIMPKTIEPSLYHYYAASVAAEFQKRLAESH